MTEPIYQKCAGLLVFSRSVAQLWSVRHAAMKNIQISSPKTDEKVARPASIIFMILAWCFLAFFFGWAFLEGEPRSWSPVVWVLVSIGMIALPLIPFQLVRY